MQVINTEIGDIKTVYPIECIDAKENIAFIDIETTGFSARTSNFYLIGCTYFKDSSWQAIQFFADEYSDEKELLTEFFEFLKSFKTLIHFNGNNFDLPFILSKCKEHGLDNNFDSYNGIDIYKRISPYRDFLRLENCKQKTVEKFLKLDREDKFSGGDLIGIYHSYVSSKDAELKRLLLLHNFEDIKGMLEILPILSYSDLFNNELKVTKVSANYYKNEEGADKAELLMVLDLPRELPVPISFLYDKCYFTGTAGQGMIKVPLYEKELKYFYANYSDYYYLPDEDVALHKSVASFVDKNHREKAKASNCYTRKTSKFLQEWNYDISPYFRESYDSRDIFFELTDERRTDRKLFSTYASHVLSHMAVR